jgi:transposase
LVAENTALRAEVEHLTRKVAELEKRLGKSSQNSSMAPSSDTPGKRAEASKSRAERRAETKASRKEEVRRRGKQHGAPGKSLRASDDPDEVVVHEPERCSSCGDDLAGAQQEGFDARQVFDTPDPKLICTEHRAVRRRCSCGAVTTGGFPPEAKAPTCYGPNVRAATLYLLFGQHLPVERTAEAISAMLGAEVSTGFVASLAGEAARGLSGFIDELKERLRRAKVIHVDETTDQVGTKKWWLHVASDELYTYLFASPTRARSAPDEAGVLGDFSGVMVHDRLAMYFSYDKATHAICHAHVLRDLASVGVRFDQGWATKMAALLCEMNDLAHAARAGGKTRLSRARLEGFLACYDAVVGEGLAANPSPAHRKRNYLERESYNLAAALRDLRSEATRFAVDLSVPFTNNEAERSLRMAKIHHKVSGCFQSEDGARNFATIRSYLATARKHDVGALHVLGRLFRGDVWMPPATT